jgi:hypothetical protein
MSILIFAGVDPTSPLWSSSSFWRKVVFLAKSLDVSATPAPRSLVLPSLVPAAVMNMLVQILFGYILDVEFAFYKLRWGVSRATLVSQFPSNCNGFIKVDELQVAIYSNHISWFEVSVDNVAPRV